MAVGDPAQRAPTMMASYTGNASNQQSHPFYAARRGLDQRWLIFCGPSSTAQSALPREQGGTAATLAARAAVSGLSVRCREAQLALAARSWSINTRRRILPDADFGIA